MRKGGIGRNIGGKEEKHRRETGKKGKWIKSEINKVKKEKGRNRKMEGKEKIGMNIVRRLEKED